MAKRACGWGMTRRWFLVWGRVISSMGWGYFHLRISWWLANGAIHIFIMQNWGQFYLIPQWGVMRGFAANYFVLSSWNGLGCILFLRDPNLSMRLPVHLYQGRGANGGPTCPRVTVSRMWPHQLKQGWFWAHHPLITLSCLWEPKHMEAAPLCALQRARENESDSQTTHWQVWAIGDKVQVTQQGHWTCCHYSPDSKYPL